MPVEGAVPSPSIGISFGFEYLSMSMSIGRADVSGGFGIVRREGVGGWSLVCTCMHGEVWER